MSSTDRELIQYARLHLADGIFVVWFAKHYQGYGRRAGSLMLGITEEQFRHRLATADRAIAAHRKETAA